MYHSPRVYIHGFSAELYAELQTTDAVHTPFQALRLGNYFTHLTSDLYAHFTPTPSEPFEELSSHTEMDLLEIVTDDIPALMSRHVFSQHRNLQHRLELLEDPLIESMRECLSLEFRNVTLRNKIVDLHEETKEAVQEPFFSTSYSDVGGVAELAYHPLDWMCSMLLQDFREQLRDRNYENLTGSFRSDVLTDEMTLTGELSDHVDLNHSFFDPENRRDPFFDIGASLFQHTQDKLA